MRSPDNRQSEAQARHAAVIVEQVLAISGEGLADEVEIQVPADQTIDRIGYVGIDRALARPEIEPGIGRDSQPVALADLRKQRSEEHTSELQSLMRISYAVFCLKKKKQNVTTEHHKETS